MANGIRAVVTGLVVWVVITVVAGLIMRGVWAEYAAVADAMTFTLPMMLVRLSIGAVATLAAGFATALVAWRATPAVLATGVILLGLFIPQHVMLWDKFPIWYHLTFLLSLVPLTYGGGKTATRWPTVRVPRRQQAMP
jgi:hypothetical protein